MSGATNNLESGSVNVYVAGGAIEANRLVKYDSTEGQVVVTSAITDIAIGVSLTKAASGQNVEVQTRGVAKVTVSDVVAIGAQLMPTSSGSGKAVTAAGATAVSCGVAEQVSAADGEIVRVRLCTPNLKGPANS